MIPYVTITPPQDLADALAWLHVLAPYLISEGVPAAGAEVLQAEKRVRCELETRAAQTVQWREKE